MKKDQPGEKNSPQGVTRRGFLSGMGTAVASTAVIPSLAASSAEAAVKPAHPLRDNAYKVDLARNILRSALIKLA